MSEEQILNPKEKKECDRCNNEADEIFECEICGILISHCCQAEYTPFSQIDYNCCKTCAPNRSDYYDI